MVLQPMLQPSLAIEVYVIQASDLENSLLKVILNFLEKSPNLRIVIQDYTPLIFFC